MVVHCSAGCGRAGTYCVVDTAIARGGWESIETIVKQFRRQRMSLVQNLRQFVLCHETFLEWMAFASEEQVEREDLEVDDMA